MKNLIISITLLIIWTVNAEAQTVKQVAPGEGTLELAIETANSNDILELTGGGKYTITDGASGFGQIKFPLTIKVEDGAQKKAILCLAENASTSKKYYFFEINDGAALTLEGLDIQGHIDGTAIAASMLIFDARPDPSIARIGNFHFNNCIFHDFKDYIIHGMKDAYARGLIQDTVFVDRVTVYNAKHFLQYKHVSLHHLEMTNSTVYNLNGMALKIGKIGYRCVLENPNKPYIPISDETITPTGFIDHCTLNNLGDIHGHIQIDNAFHTLNFTNNIISHQQQFDQPPIYINEPMCDTAGIIQNTCFWDCGPPNDEVGGTSWIAYVFKDDLSVDPLYQDAPNGNFSLPFDSPLLTAGTGGDQIGDTRWGVYNPTGITKNKLSNKITRLEHNHPNPFHGSTEISFFISEPALVSIKIYNIMGMEIENLTNDNFPVGNHSILWNASKNQPGIYLCKMQTGDYIKTLPMVLK